MEKFKLVLVLVLFLNAENLYSQNQVQNLEDEINSLSFIKQGLEDSIRTVNSKIDSLELIISNINFEALSTNKQEVKLNVGAIIYSSSNVNSNRLLTTTGDSKAYIVEVDGSNYVKVNVDGIEGYAPRWGFEDEVYINKLIDEAKVRQPSRMPEEPIVRINYEQQRALADQKRRNDFIEKNPNLSQNLRNQIQNGQISIGMTREMAEASWGEPRDINRTVTANMVREQWVYGFTSNRRYLYFRNGILDTFQD